MPTDSIRDTAFCDVLNRELVCALGCTCLLYTSGAVDGRSDGTLIGLRNRSDTYGAL